MGYPRTGKSACATGSFDGATQKRQYFRKQVQGKQGGRPPKEGRVVEFGGGMT